MKEKLQKIYLILILFFITMCFDKVYAATITCTPSKTNVTVGDTFSITVSVNAGSWNLAVNSGGMSFVSDASGFVGYTSKTDNDSASKTYSFKASTVGTYTIMITGDITDYYDDIPREVNEKITINVSAPQPSPTPQPPTFSSRNETVYATTEVNVRSSYSTSSSSLGKLPQGGSVTRTGVSDVKVNGYYWSKVTFNGQTGYIASNFLTTTKPAEQPSPSPSPTPSTEDEKSNDSTLKSLSITGVEFTPAFDPTVTSYVANIGTEITEVEVIAEVNNEKAKYEIVGNTELQDGENNVVVTVTAEDGTVTNYEIKLIRGEEAIPLDILALVGIKENDETVDIELGAPDIIDGIVEYTINLSEYMKAIDIISTQNIESYVYEGIGKFDLSVGENKYTVLLKIQQEGEEPKTIEYRLTINNPEKVVEAGAVEKTNYGLIIIIGAVAGLTIIGIIFAVLYYRKQNDLKYAKPDYSFLREDEDIKDKEQKRTQDNNYMPENNQDIDRRRGGKHF